MERNRPLFKRYECKIIRVITILKFLLGQPEFALLTRGCAKTLAPCRPCLSRRLRLHRLNSSCVTSQAVWQLTAAVHSSEAMDLLRPWPELRMLTSWVDRIKTHTCLWLFRNSKVSLVTSSYQPRVCLGALGRLGTRTRPEVSWWVRWRNRLRKQTHCTRRAHTPFRQNPPPQSYLNIIDEGRLDVRSNPLLRGVVHFLLLLYFPMTSEFKGKERKTIYYKLSFHSPKPSVLMNSKHFKMALKPARWKCIILSIVF